MTPQPPANQDEPLKEQQRQLQELLFALHLRDRPTLVFLEVNSPRKAAELKTFLRENLTEYQFYNLDLTPHPTVSLLRTLTEQLPAEVVKAQPVQYCIHVHGLENSLLTNEAGRIVPSRLTAQLNLERELLFRNVPYNILIWADSDFFKTIQREAPDLWSWVTYKFRFDDPDAFTPDQHPPLPPARLEPRGNIAERQTRIQELEETLNRLNQNTEDKLRLQRDKVSILHLLAQEYQEAFEFEKAEEAYLKAIAIAERIRVGDDLLGNLGFNLAGLYLTTRQFEKALKCYHKVMSLANEINLGTIYHQIGIVYEQEGYWQEALENYTKALDWKNRTRNDFELSKTYYHIGRGYAGQYDWKQALENFQQALDWSIKTGNTVSLGNIYHQIGRVYEGQSLWNLSLRNYQNALDWKRKTGNEFELGGTYHQIGMVYEQQQRWNEALESYQSAIDWFVKTGNDFFIGNTYHQIGLVYEEQEDLETAQDWFKKSVENFTRFQNPNLPVAQESLDRVQQLLKKA